MLEKTYAGQMEWSLFFAYSDREHIRAILRDMYVDNPDPDVVEWQTDRHYEGESADLWLVERGRLVGHVDLLPFLRDPDGQEGSIEVDWDGFGAAVPATLPEPLLAPGEELHATGNLGGELRSVLEQHRIMYGMQIWVDGDMTDQPYEVFTDPLGTERE